MLKKRINYEFSLIIQKGFAPYFLIVKTLFNKLNPLLVADPVLHLFKLLLYITQVDPSLQSKFERFIHPERINMPDIDIDFPPG
ncbi:MAG: hypothetical protein CM1200mP10_20970 [Candidatus Neomarinimicrobiota bacterium]|nr:MAG: hypothetical protein CM1200mP10_20970 [Candidatus Neomarinimicrobiota bacterium]